MKISKAKINWRKWTLIGGVVFLLVGILKIVLLPGGPHLECHRALDGCFQEWLLENGKSNAFPNTNAYPNIDGNSEKSLMSIKPYFGPDSEQALHDYIYIPGLRFDDPSDLVLLYVRKASRRRWHGDAPTIFREKKWIAIDPTFGGEEGGGELNDWISAEELKKRIQKTLDFIKTKNRPNWEKIVAEQNNRLNSIHD